MINCKDIQKANPAEYAANNKHVYATTESSPGVIVNISRDKT